MTSFAQLLEAWYQEIGLEDIPVQQTGGSNLNHERSFRFRSREYECLVEGIPYEDEQTHFTDAHVFWVRDKNHRITACYLQRGILKECTMIMCNQVWGGIDINTIENNIRYLPNGTKIPLVPNTYLQYRQTNNKRSTRQNTSCSNKRPRTEIKDMFDTNETHHFHPELKQILECVNIDLFPTIEEMRQSCLILPPGWGTLIRSKSQTGFIAKQGVTENVQTKPPNVNVRWSQACHILHQARMAALQHPLHEKLLEEHPLHQLKSVDDLPHICAQHVSISKEVLQLFHYFFPLENK